MATESHRRSYEHKKPPLQSHLRPRSRPRRREDVYDRGSTTLQYPCLQPPKNLYDHLRSTSYHFEEFVLGGREVSANSNNP